MWNISIQSSNTCNRQKIEHSLHQSTMLSLYFMTKIPFYVILFGTKQLNKA